MFYLDGIFLERDYMEPENYKKQFYETMEKATNHLQDIIENPDRPIFFSPENKTLYADSIKSQYPYGLGKEWEF